MCGLGQLEEPGREHRGHPTWKGPSIPPSYLEGIPAPESTGKQERSIPMTERGQDPGWAGLAPEAKDRGKVGPRDSSSPRVNPLSTYPWPPTFLPGPHSITHSFGKYSLSTYYVSGTVPGTLIDPQSRDRNRQEARKQIFSYSTCWNKLSEGDKSTRPWRLKGRLLGGEVAEASLRRCPLSLKTLLPSWRHLLSRWEARIPHSTSSQTVGRSTVD